MSSLQTILQFFRDHSRTEREKGTYFEDLSKIYFQHDAIQQQEYSQVSTYAEWAIDTPDSRNPCIHSAWIFDNNSQSPRLVTTFPNQKNAY